MDKVTEEYVWEKIIFDPSWAAEFTSFLLVCRIRYRVNHFELVCGVFRKKRLYPGGR